MLRIVYISAQSVLKTRLGQISLPIILESILSLLNVRIEKKKMSILVWVGYFFLGHPVTSKGFTLDYKGINNVFNVQCVNKK